MRLASLPSGSAQRHEDSDEEEEEEELRDFDVPSSSYAHRPRTPSPSSSDEDEVLEERRDSEDETESDQQDGMLSDDGDATVYYTPLASPAISLPDLLSSSPASTSSSDTVDPGTTPRQTRSGAPVPASAPPKISRTQPHAHPHFNLKPPPTPIQAHSYTTTTSKSASTEYDPDEEDLSSWASHSRSSVTTTSTTADVEGKLVLPSQLRFSVVASSVPSESSGRPPRAIEHVRVEVRHPSPFLHSRLVLTTAMND